MHRRRWLLFLFLFLRLVLRLLLQGRFWRHDIRPIPRLYLWDPSNGLIQAIRIHTLPIDTSVPNRGPIGTRNQNRSFWFP
ncbi:hypothetical protein P691DRAFT_812157 [Macrolepiota fuliginosa MF-IS2]|uniref:Secreted protein n=1 Tax=Macrolepiota fuliginosa MF-IS2 TaxID=1400762 RepID=A0A9P5XG40_9AGAR|nr:hypothetical protein P691DRAFT_812157 [Macrolepiota fuliginosa MF-IS2]